MELNLGLFRNTFFKKGMPSSNQMKQTFQVLYSVSGTDFRIYKYGPTLNIHANAHVLDVPI